MKTYKTWEMVKMLTENPGLKFRCNGDGCIISVYVGADGFLALDNLGCSDELEGNINLKDTWQLIQEPVTWQEALEAWALHEKQVSYELDGSKYLLWNKWQTGKLTAAAIVRGKWYIEDGEPSG